MKKGILERGLVLALTMAFLAGCGGSAGTTRDSESVQSSESGDVQGGGQGEGTSGPVISETKGSGKYYTKTTVSDQVVDIPAFSTLLPENWTMSIQSNWQNVDTEFPGRELVTITNPEGTATIYILSPQSYLWTFSETWGMASYQGVSLEYFGTYVEYMKAGDALEAQMDNGGYSGRTLTQEVEDGEGALEAAKTLAENLADTSEANMAAMNIRAYGWTYTILERLYDYAKRQYRNSDGSYLEASTITLGYTGRLSGTTTNRTTGWYIPYFIVYQASSKEAFDQYYDDYGLIVENGCFSPEFFYLNKAYSDHIVEQIAKMQAIKSQAELDAVNKYLMDDYSDSTSGDARSTSERVMEMWDDVIKEVDTYVTEDGTRVKTSTSNETMAQDGDNYYVGDRSGIPDGYTELRRDY